MSEMRKIDADTWLAKTKSVSAVIQEVPQQIVSPYAQCSGCAACPSADPREKKHAVHESDKFNEIMARMTEEFKIDPDVPTKFVTPDADESDDFDDMMARMEEEYKIGTQILCNAGKYEEDDTGAPAESQTPKLGNFDIITWLPDGTVFSLDRFELVEGRLIKSQARVERCNIYRGRGRGRGKGRGRAGR